MSDSTLTGYVPMVGDVVWQQMYSPSHPDWGSTIEERVAAGQLYGIRRMMRVAGIIPDHRPGVTRWHLVDVERPNDESRMSWVEADWCVLEPAAGDLGTLF